VKANIEDLRKKLNISQIDMAKMLQIPVSTYNMYENGKRKVPEKVANKIAEILNVKLEEIFLPATFTVSKTKENKANDEVESA